MTDQPEADGCDRRSQHAACRGVQHGRGNDNPEDGPRCVGQRAHADGNDRQGGYEALGSRRIDQRASRHLPGERNEAADRHDETDVDLRPFLRGQIDGNKWTEPGLYVSEAEDEPIEPAQTAGRWMRQPFRALQWRCCTRHALRFAPSRSNLLSGEHDATVCLIPATSRWSWAAPRERAR